MAASLLDIVTRQQIYLEGVKLEQSTRFNSVIRELNKELRLLFAGLSFETLDEMSKTALNNFIREVRKMQKKVFNQYTTQLLKMLREFMIVEKNLTTDLMEDFTELETPKDKVKDNDSLWSIILAAAIPGNGILLRSFVAGFAISSIVTIENLIRQGHANKDSVKVALESITGTKDVKFKNGAFSRIFNNARSVINTSFQHVSAITKHSVQSLFYDCYEWISVIDSKTTEICRSRDGKVYRMFEGPLPPAHINCRSATRPVECPVDPNKPRDSSNETYYEWLKRQSTAFLNDFLGKQKTSALISGKKSTFDFTKFNSGQQLTFDDYLSKLNIITSTD